MTFRHQFEGLLRQVWDDGEEVEVGQWQSQDVSNDPRMISRELRHVTFRYPHVPSSVQVLQRQVQPNLPWAEDHFLERVSGEPLNPPPSERYWPYAQNGNAAHKDGEKFSHTYPERMWPKHAGELLLSTPNAGLRYDLGDLEDLVNQLAKNPLTRQAYLPIWFPEDTGAVYGQRVPCTLGYHFLIRQGRAEIVYYIRSCDLLRHFTDDVYMACRLLQWVVGKLRERSVDVEASSLIMHISSLHIFRGDYEPLKLQLAAIDRRREDEEDIYGAAV